MRIEHLGWKQRPDCTACKKVILNRDDDGEEKETREEEERRRGESERGMGYRNFLADKEQ